MKDAQVEQRLPLVELAFPTLKQRTPEFLTQLLETVDSLIAADGRTAAEGAAQPQTARIRGPFVRLPVTGLSKRR